MPPPADVRDIAQAQAHEQPVPNMGRAVSHLVSLICTQGSSHGLATLGFDKQRLRRKAYNRVEREVSEIAPTILSSLPFGNRERGQPRGHLIGSGSLLGLIGFGRWRWGSR
jgi:hypothetical protein